MVRFQFKIVSKLLQIFNKSIHSLIQFVLVNFKTLSRHDKNKAEKTSQKWAINTIFFSVSSRKLKNLFEFSIKSSYRKGKIQRRISVIVKQNLI